MYLLAYFTNAILFCHSYFSPYNVNNRTLLSPLWIECFSSACILKGNSCSECKHCSIGHFLLNFNFPSFIHSQFSITRLGYHHKSILSSNTSSILFCCSIRNPCNMSLISNPLASPNNNNKTLPVRVSC